MNTIVLIESNLENHYQIKFTWVNPIIETVSTFSPLLNFYSIIVLLLLNFVTTRERMSLHIFYWYPLGAGTIYKWHRLKIGDWWFLPSIQYFFNLFLVYGSIYELGLLGNPSPIERTYFMNVPSNMTIITFSPWSLDRFANLLWGWHVGRGLFCPAQWMEQDRTWSEA